MVYRPEISGRTNKGFTESIEDYLEEIYLDYIGSNTGVRITDLAQAMGVTKASATDAVKKMKDRGLVRHERYGRIYLSDAGLQAAKEVYDRHVTITQFIRNFLDVSPEVAENDACGIEHIISDETFSAIKAALRRQAINEMNGNKKDEDE